MRHRVSIARPLGHGFVQPTLPAVIARPPGHGLTSPTSPGRMLRACPRADEVEALARSWADQPLTFVHKYRFWVQPYVEGYHTPVQYGFGAPRGTANPAAA